MDLWPDPTDFRYDFTRTEPVRVFFSNHPMFHLSRTDELQQAFSPGAARLMARCLLNDRTLSDQCLVRRLTFDPPFVFWILTRRSADGVIASHDCHLEAIAQSLTRDRLVPWLNDHFAEGSDRSICVDVDARVRMAISAAATLHAHYPPEQIRTSPAALALLVNGIADHWKNWFGTCEITPWQAILASFTASHQPSEVSHSGLDRVLEAELHHHWHDDDDSWTILTNLIEQQRRLQMLESRFDETLEREKLAAMKQLAYGASHEINNPLANISSRAQTLLRDEVDPLRQRTLAAINRQAFRAHEMIADMMHFAHPPRLEKSLFNAVDLFTEVVNELGPGAEQQDTKLVVQDGDVEIMGDRVQVHVAVKALVRNSLESLGQGGTVRMQSTFDNQSVQLTVIDNGPGIPDDVRRHLFDPFFSGREAGRGLGFGLSKVWRIAQEHGGDIVVHSSDADGTEITLFIPSVTKPPTSTFQSS